MRISIRIKASSGPTIFEIKDRVVVADSVSDPYSFFTDPDPVNPDRGQYGSGYGSGSNPDPGL
jgi:hypothetical protein